MAMGKILIYMLLAAGPLLRLARRKSYVVKTDNSDGYPLF